MVASSKRGSAAGARRPNRSSDSLHTLRAVVLQLRQLLEGSEPSGSADGPAGPTPGDSREPVGDLWRQLRAARLGGGPRPGGGEADARANAEPTGPSVVSDPEWVQHSAMFWSNRLLTLRCLEARGLIDEVIVRRAIYGGRSLRHYRLIQRQPEQCAGDDDGLRAVLEQASAELSAQLPSLFGPTDAAGLLAPSVAALDRVIGLLSGEWAPRGVERADDELFRDPTALAWGYQFWNAERKDRIFDRLRHQRGERLAGDDLSAATQLYTEPHLVRFVLHNTLGACWAAWHPDSKLLESWPLLVRRSGGVAPPRRPLRELTVLDPACGSGHFLLEAFDMLFAMYQEEGALDDPHEIAQSILRHNLLGIDIDGRAVQLAEALLWMRAAERCPGLPPVAPNLVALDARFSRWVAYLRVVAAGEPRCARLADRLRPLEQAHELGSLLTVALSAAELEELQAALARSGERGAPGDGTNGRSSDGLGSDDRRGFETLRRVVRASERRYDVIATNPPYAGFRLLAPHVKQEVVRRIPDASLDIYVAFVAHFFERLAPHGRLGVVSPASWTTSSHTRAVRQRILDEGGPVVVAALGQGVFETAPLLFVTLAVVQRAEAEGSRELTTLRVAPRSGAEGLRAACERGGEIWPWALLRGLEGVPFLPAAPPLLLERSRGEPTVGDLFTLTDGVWSGSSDRDVREGWELPRGTPGWEPASGGQGYCRWYAPIRRRLRQSPEGARTARRARIDRAPLEYARVAGGRLAARFVSAAAAHSPEISNQEGGIPSVAIAGVVRLALRPNAEPSRVEQLAAVFNTRVGQLWLRTLASGLNFNPGYAARVPLATALPSPALVAAVGRVVALKQQLARWEPTADDFDPRLMLPPVATGDDLGQHLHRCVCDRLELVVRALEVESDVEALLAAQLGLPDEVVAAIDRQLGLPVARLPRANASVPAEPEAEGEVEADPTATETFPAESALEVLARRWGVHPRTILDAIRAAGPSLGASGALRAQRGLSTRQGGREAVSNVEPGADTAAEASALLAKEATRLLGDYLTLVVLRLGLEPSGGSHSTDDQEPQPTADPWAAVGEAWSEDGIVLVTAAPSRPRAAVLVRAELGSDFPAHSLARIEQQAAQLLGRPLEQWLERDLCVWHSRRLFRRPVLWQLESGPRRGRSAFCCWLHAHRVDHDSLPKILSHHLADRVRSLRAELDAMRPTPARAAKPSRRAAQLESQLAELSSFADRLRSVIADGFGSASTPGDARYEPELADGVRVNVAPLSRRGLLAYDVLDRAQLERALADRRQWRLEAASTAARSGREAAPRTGRGRPSGDRQGGEP